MTRKTIIVADPGIDGACAVAVAMLSPEVDLIGLAATAGNVGAEQATRNVHVLVEQLDPPRWPRLGAALPVEYDVAATDLHGPDGLGGANFLCAQLHHPHPSDKLLTDLVRQHPREVTVLLLGPATVFARALDRDPDLATLVERLVIVGGARHEAGDATAAAEFHFYCDPLAARQVLRCGAPITLLPLDITRKLVLSPADLRKLPPEESRTGKFLRQVVPHAIAPTASRYGIEGVYLNDVLGVAYVAEPTTFTTKPIFVDVETRGELTRGAAVFDDRWACTAKPNIDLVSAVDLAALRQFVQRALADGDKSA
jgi:inosine-uridine nucleoside N-ribohydrolase